jgi:acyl-CoA dehydrogenase
MTMANPPTTDTSARDMLVETLERIAAEHGGGEVVSALEDGEWPGELWQMVEAAELPWVPVPLPSGGAGGDMEIAAALWRGLGQAPLPVPVGETAIAGCLMAAAGLTVPRHVLTFSAGGVLEARRSGRDLLVSGSLRRVPWARFAALVVGLAESSEGLHVVAVPVSELEVSVGRNLAGEPRDDVSLDDVRLGPESTAAAPPAIDAQTPLYCGALLRTQMMAGAMNGAVRRTIAYTSERQQFGRAIGSFQAVQHLVIAAASEAALAEVAAQLAASAARSGAGRSGAGRREIAAAKAVAGDAAGLVAARCHQAHGAIGATREYSLQRWTRRLWAWREECGDTTTWRRSLGHRIAAVDADDLWGLVSAEPGAGGDDGVAALFAGDSGHR